MIGISQSLIESSRKRIEQETERAAREQAIAELFDKHVTANHRDTADQGQSIGATEYYRHGTGRVFDDGARKPYAQVHYNGRLEFLHQEVTAITDGDGITRHLSRPIRLL